MTTRRDGVPRRLVLPARVRWSTNPRNQPAGTRPWLPYQLAAPYVARDRDLHNRALLRGWLYVVLLVLFALVLVGGATRLTDSGLSITRMEADPRRHPAAQRRRVAGGIPALPADPAICRAQQGHEHRGVQVDLLVGMGAPHPGAQRRRGLCLAAAVLLGDAPHRARPGAETGRHSSARRPAGRHRLVDGGVRPGRPGLGQPVPAGDASDAGGADLHRDHGRRARAGAAFRTRRRSLDAAAGRLSSCCWR